ncbi:hypothetical protein [Alteromonas gilva]|uniref:Uncharacterized protein n=1 Tax=Alteromonas gilva TaxID=2987522 RepID=A0ABT5L452_9ALTE|nr:hypothetical protein [Alteromonas gilva]MDC8831809.1 hypothetical protein [Alteromonas gilva]
MGLDGRAKKIIYEQLHQQSSVDNRLALYRSLEMIEGEKAWTHALNDDAAIIRAAKYKLSI